MFSQSLDDNLHQSKMEEFEKLLTETATLQYKLQKLQKQEADLRRNVLFMKTQHAQLFPDEDGL